MQRQCWRAIRTTRMAERWRSVSCHGLIRRLWMSAIGPKQTLATAPHMSAFGGKQTCLLALQISAFDPKRIPGPFRMSDGTITMPCSEIGAGMRRRGFIGFVSAALVWPVIAGAQQADKTPRVAFLGGDRTSPALIGYYQAFSAQLEMNGFREGQNIVIEYRSTNDPRGPFVAAAELLRSQPDLIVAVGPEVTLQAVVGASAHIPIVMLAVNYDPIERGYVTSLGQPGGNITGLVVRPLDLARKQIDLLRQAFPDRDRLAVLYDPLTADQFTAANQA